MEYRRHWRALVAALACCFSGFAVTSFHLPGSRLPSRQEAERHLAAREFTLAVHGLRLAAESGDALAAVELGDLYAGLDLPVRDTQLAAVWYRRAASNSADAAWKLGRLYESGEGVELNPETAAGLYRVAAERGSAGAQNALGNLALASDDPAAALAWYRLAVSGGSAEAMLNIAGMYYHGLGLSCDRALALEWARRALVLQPHDAASIVDFIERASAPAE
jgi:TPR repeat protein